MLWGASVVVVIGCATGNHARVGELPQFPPFADSGQTLAEECWWTAFANSELDSYIEKAFADNYSLEAALQRVLAARAIARREASDLFIDLNGLLGINSTFGPGPDSTIYNLGFDVSYQVDLWGEIESRIKAQELIASASCQDYRVIALTLSGDIVSTWCALIESRAQIELLDVQIETNRKGLETQESRFELGRIRIADVLRQQQLLESTLEQKVLAESRLEVLEHQLALLLGEPPQSATYQTGSVLPELPGLPATGLPSDLILRRPDIRRDYLELCAADQTLAAAISAQFPRLNLSTSVSNIADDPSTWFRDWFASIGAQLIGPILDGGQRRAEVDRACAFKRQLFNNYTATVLVAFQEVEDSLAQEKFQIQRIQHLEEQVRLAGEASNQLREQYLIGDAEFLDVLSAITGQQSLQRQLLSAQLELRLIRISLYLALAGGFDPNDCAQQTRQTVYLMEERDQNADNRDDDESMDPQTVEPIIDESKKDEILPGQNFQDEQNDDG